MEIEYEATFININKDEIRRRLKAGNAVLVKKEFLQKRTVFMPPKGTNIPGGWLRVRDEGNRITMSLKIVKGNKITDQKEICLRVDDYNKAVDLLKSIGCQEKAYQESKREAWQLNGVYIFFDEWPFLELFVEIEGKSEEAVKKVSEKIGFNWYEAKFCAVDKLYSEKYNLSKEIINNHTPKIVFDMKNPFVNRK